MGGKWRLDGGLEGECFVIRGAETNKKGRAKPIKLPDIAEQDSETCPGGHSDTAQCSIGHFQPTTPQKHLLLCKAARYVARVRIRILTI